MFPTLTQERREMTQEAMAAGDAEALFEVANGVGVAFLLERCTAVQTRRRIRPENLRGQVPRHAENRRVPNEWMGVQRSWTS